MPKVLIEGKSCFYQDVGEGYPILLGHSYLWTSEMWKPQLKELSKQYRCIAVDLWDHGNSGTSKNDSLEQLAHDYSELMKRLEIHEYVVVGLSVLKIIEKAGHICNLEQPAIVTSILLNFLEKVCKEKQFTAL